MTSGQASLEFLSTYGIAFLALLITLGTLSYLDIFNTGTIRSNECSFPSGTNCLDFVLIADTPPDQGAVNPISLPLIKEPYVKMDLYNSYGVNITIVNITMTMSQFGGAQSCAVIPGPDPANRDWPAATNKTVWCPVPSSSYHPTVSYDGSVSMNFTQQGGSYVHSIKGILQLTAQ